MSNKPNVTYNSDGTITINKSGVYKIYGDLFQCPYSEVASCRMDEPCEECETYCEYLREGNK